MGLPVVGRSALGVAQMLRNHDFPDILDELLYCFEFLARVLFGGCRS